MLCTAFQVTFYEYRCLRDAMKVVSFLIQSLHMFAAGDLRLLAIRNLKVRCTVSTVRAARGVMTRYIIKNRISTPEGLKGFDESGYRFIDTLSTATEYVFIQRP